MPNLPTSDELLDCIELFVRDWEQLALDMHHIRGDSGHEWLRRWKNDDHTTPALVEKARALLLRCGRGVPLPKPRKIDRRYGPLVPCDQCGRKRGHQVSCPKHRLHK